MKKLLPIFIIAILVVGVGTFFGGMKYGESKTVLSNQNRFQQANIGANVGARGTMKVSGNGNFLAGEIISKDDKSITVKLNNGGSKIVFLSESTQVQKTASGTIDDLIVGEQATITGTTNSNGSVTAQSIQIRPAQ